LLKFGVYKKGNRQQISNYRPILVLFIFSNIFEKIVYNRLVNFISKYKILTGNQYGFQKNKSTISACQSFIPDTQEAPDRQSFAYDVIDHDILLEKLDHYGIRRIIKIWLKSYLTLRSQFVERTTNDNKYPMNSYNSTPRYIKCGIPQGSIFGRLLFLLYINDLPQHISNAEVVLFADDANILAIDKNINTLQEKINRVMIQLESWFSKNNLVINTLKLKLCYFN
jgi:hypothetical protein